MEFLVEILVQLLWIVVQFVFEIVLQIVFEGLVELISHIARGIVKPRRASPAAAVLLCVLLGAIAGVVSLWPFPDLFIRPLWARWLNLIVTPIVAGATMAAIGSWRKKKGQDLINLDSFGYGVLFALSMALVRMIWGK